MLLETCWVVWQRTCVSSAIQNVCVVATLWSHLFFFSCKISFNSVINGIKKLGVIMILKDLEVVVFFVFLTKHFRDSLHRQSQFCLCTFLENLLFTSSCVEAENGRACTYFLDNEIFVLSSRDEKVFSFILSSRENKSSISHNNEIISNKTKQLYKIHKSGP